MREETKAKILESKTASVVGQPDKIVNIQTVVEPAEEYVYSNIAGMSISPWDVRINFAELLPNPSTSEQKARTKTVAGIVMTPEHAAGLVLLLMRQLIAYELNIGPIRNEEWHRLAGEAKHHLIPEEEETIPLGSKP